MKDNCLIDFTNYKARKKSYNGANGYKKSIMIDNSLYMLKLPSHAKLNPNMSYANSPISEYIASFIFKMAKIDCQETKLGKYSHNGIERLAVACKDFTYPDYSLNDFASLRNQLVDSISEGRSTELKDIIEIFDEQEIIDSKELKVFFYDVLVVDALLGNFDRHNGNWGYLYDAKSDEAKIAPVYDNGSSLFPQADEKIMKLVLENRTELNKRIYDKPQSAITINGIKMNYYNYFNKMENADLNEALKKIVPLLKMDDIKKFIDEIECLTNIQKNFYKTIISERYKHILLAPYKKLINSL